MILVTGGAGYIGSHTCVALLDAGYDITVVDNFANSNPKAIERIKSITGKDFPFYQIDVCDYDALDRVFFLHNIDVVIHFAGLKAVGESVAKPLMYYEQNLTSTIALLHVMQRHDTKHLIFSSSATVYHADNAMPLTEDSRLGCINPYGWTKLFNEQIITDTIKAQKNASAVLLRYFNPIGAHPSGNIGEDPLGIPNNLFPYITQTAVGKLNSLPVYGNDYDTPDGTGIRDYIHVMDLAEGHVAAVKYVKKHKGTHAFNLGTGEGTSVMEMIHAFEAVSGVKIKYHIVARRPGDLPIGYADPSHAEKELRWKAQKTLQESCADSWRWQSKNPNGYQSES